jgi:hypothetical protein
MHWLMAPSLLTDARNRKRLSMKRYTCFALVLLLPGGAEAEILVSQTPGGGVARSSQLWQDPGPDGNDLDSDAVCWQDFTLTQNESINHIEWWGSGASELGFQIEFWKQDPNTIAYQPLGLFYYGGVHTIAPEPPGFIQALPIRTAGPGGLTHFVVDLVTPVSLAANDIVNPRWFVGIVGLTSQPFVTWNWAQGVGGSTRSYQFLRADGRTFRPLPEGRALVLGAAGEQGDYDSDGDVDGADFLRWQREFGRIVVPQGRGADGDGSGQVDAEDLAIWQQHYGGTTPLMASSQTIPEPESVALTTIICLVTTILRLNLGGQIRHLEIRGPVSTA